MQPGLRPALLACLTLVCPMLADSTPDRIGDAWSDPRNPIVQIFQGQRLDLWSLRPLATPAIPHVSDASRVRNPIDAFILARLDQAGLAPSPEADRRTLARRLAFDLTGLPPTADQVDAFLTDANPSAYDRYVDHLLNSPRYGEHWARLWLDVVRYSDSNGFDWDEFRPQAWRFRDYVVRSLNADKPFNQFVVEQLAGDELLSGPPTTLAEQDQLIATGYLRLGPHDNSAGLFNEQARSRAELMFDLVETTSSAFLGLNLSCSRCHDHKTDPLSQADYYRLRAFFESVKFADDLPLDLDSEQKSIQDHNRALAQRLQPLQQELEAISHAARQRIYNQRLGELPPEDQLLLELPQTDLSHDQLTRLTSLRDKLQPKDEELANAMTTTEAGRQEALAEQINTLKNSTRRLSYGLLMTDQPEPSPLTHVLYQGNHKEERESVQAGFFSILDPNPADIPPSPNPKTKGRRLALAEWIASESNPLTARVWVNRVWQAYFGSGLVATPNDFGVAGARPTHPDLLDWLSRQFMDRGWSLKELHRLIVTSATYRQASTSPNAPAAQSDPGNTLLWRQSLKRLTAEQLRDATLSVAGILQPCAGGPPAWPELPQDILTANPAFLDDNAEKTKGWYPSPPAQRLMRSLYLVQKRTVRVPFMETFDLPENMVSCGRRDVSVVAPQALTLLNGRETTAAAHALAERVAREAGLDHVAQVRHAFRLALQRAPAPDELDRCQLFLSRQSLPELCRALLNLNEFIYVD